MAKKSAKKAGHQNFKLSPHGHPQDKVMLYVVVAVLVGLAIGWFFKDPIIAALGGNPVLY